MHAAASVGTATNGALTVWNFRCVGGLGALCADALPSNPGASGTPLYSGLYTGAVNFQMPAVFDSVGAFLATGGGSFNSPLTFGDYATVLSTGFTHNVGIVTLMEFTFTLTGTDLLKIQHDDGESASGTARTRTTISPRVPPIRRHSRQRRSRSSRARTISGTPK